MDQNFTTHTDLFTAFSPFRDALNFLPSLEKMYFEIGFSYHVIPAIHVVPWILLLDKKKRFLCYAALCFYLHLSNNQF